MKMPDLDRSGSLITQLPGLRWFTRPAARVTEHLVRHRTGTHSLFTIAALSFAAFCLRDVFTPAACGAFLIGYLSHILADSLMISGVPLLWPYKRKEYSPLPRVLRIRTGGVHRHAAGQGGGRSFFDRRLIQVYTLCVRAVLGSAGGDDVVDEGWQHDLSHAVFFHESVYRLFAL